MPAMCCGPEKGQMKPDQKGPGIAEAQFLVEHQAQSFRIPVINRGKDGKEQSAINT